MAGFFKRIGAKISERAEEIEERRPDIANDRTLRDLDHRIEELSVEVTRLRELLESLRLQQYVRALLNKRYIALMGLLNGVMSGLGAVIGATVLLALLLFILGKLQVLPYIGKFIAELIRIVQSQPKH